MNSQSSITKQVKTDHKDLIQDIAFDFYGKRVATASLVIYIFRFHAKILKNKQSYLIKLYISRISR